ncbi:hypothetical protein ACA910_002160 [Epithemia clementina (nom. ined.)]
MSTTSSTASSTSAASRCSSPYPQAPCAGWLLQEPDTMPLSLLSPSSSSSPSPSPSLSKRKKQPTPDPDDDDFCFESTFLPQLVAATAHFTPLSLLLSSSSPLPMSASSSLSSSSAAAAACAVPRMRHQDCLALSSSSLLSHNIPKTTPPVVAPTSNNTTTKPMGIITIPSRSNQNNANNNHDTTLVRLPPPSATTLPRRNRASLTSHAAAVTDTTTTTRAPPAATTTTAAPPKQSRIHHDSNKPWPPSSRPLITTDPQMPPRTILFESKGLAADATLTSQSSRSFTTSPLSLPAMADLKTPSANNHDNDKNNNNNNKSQSKPPTQTADTALDTTAPPGTVDTKPKDQNKSKVVPVVAPLEQEQPPPQHHEDNVPIVARATVPFWEGQNNSKGNNHKNNNHKTGRAQAIATETAAIATAAAVTTKPLPSDNESSPPPSSPLSLPSISACQTLRQNKAATSASTVIATAKTAATKAPGSKATDTNTSPRTAARTNQESSNNNDSNRDNDKVGSAPLFRNNPTRTGGGITPRTTSSVAFQQARAMFAATTNTSTAPLSALSIPERNTASTNNNNNKTTTTTTTTTETTKSTTTKAAASVVPPTTTKSCQTIDSSTAHDVTKVPTTKASYASPSKPSTENRNDTVTEIASSAVASPARMDKNNQDKGACGSSSTPHPQNPDHHELFQQGRNEETKTELSSPSLSEPLIEAWETPKKSSTTASINPCGGDGGGGGGEETETTAPSGSTTGRTASVSNNDDDTILANKDETKNVENENSTSEQPTKDHTKFPLRRTVVQTNHRGPQQQPSLVAGRLLAWEEAIRKNQNPHEAASPLRELPRNQKKKIQSPLWLSSSDDDDKNNNNNKDSTKCGPGKNTDENSGDGTVLDMTLSPLSSSLSSQRFRSNRIGPVDEHCSKGSPIKDKNNKSDNEGANLDGSMSSVSLLSQSFTSNRSGDMVVKDSMKGSPRSKITNDEGARLNASMSPFSLSSQRPRSDVSWRVDMDSSKSTPISKDKNDRDDKNPEKDDVVNMDESIAPPVSLSSQPSWSTLSRDMVVRDSTKGSPSKDKKNEEARLNVSMSPVSLSSHRPRSYVSWRVDTDGSECSPNKNKDDEKDQKTDVRAILDGSISPVSLSSQPSRSNLSRDMVVTDSTKCSSSKDNKEEGARKNASMSSLSLPSRLIRPNVSWRVDTDNSQCSSSTNKYEDKEQKTDNGTILDASVSSVSLSSQPSRSNLSRGMAVKDSTKGSPSKDKKNHDKNHKKDDVVILDESISILSLSSQHFQSNLSTDMVVKESMKCSPSKDKNGDEAVLDTSMSPLSLSSQLSRSANVSGRVDTDSSKCSVSMNKDEDKDQKKDDVAILGCGRVDKERTKYSPNKSKGEDENRNTDDVAILNVSVSPVSLSSRCFTSNLIGDMVVEDSMKCSPIKDKKDEGVLLDTSMSPLSLSSQYSRLNVSGRVDKDDMPTAEADLSQETTNTTPTMNIINIPMPAADLSQETTTTATTTNSSWKSVDGDDDSVQALEVKLFQEQPQHPPFLVKTNRCHRFLRRSSTPGPLSLNDLNHFPSSARIMKRMSMNHQQQHSSLFSGRWMSSCS